ncbi:4-hydroxyphenylpyruvate dioxygenase-like [Lolium rigidum]|uniref:4-hydroxyphenylpyruvate dioxygenase-like n=1 Tax=Lolium rigidum TaxID=89674 RepID=UPI001F5CD55A|nr:4-hydroxyphenylpyruvate dioxygenase-like [Lolium rigidum]
MYAATLPAPNTTMRATARTDRFQAHAFHHVELWCADAAGAASRFSSALGVPLAAVSDLSTGNSAHASRLLRSGSLSLLFTSSHSQQEHHMDGATIPSFSPNDASRFVADHGGPAVRAIAVRVSDAAEAFRASVDAGARPAFAPADLGLGFCFAEVELYGDVVLRFVSCPADNAVVTFLPGFEDIDVDSSGAADYGLRRIDHVVGCLPELAPVAEYIASFTGFHEFVEFTAEDVGTAESGLNVVVLANKTETVLLNLTEPVHGTKRRSQIQTYLDHHGGPGVQHIALASDDVLGTLRQMMRAAGAFEFLEPPPPNYYDGVRRRAGDVLSEAQIKGCQELGVLVDRDDQGVLLQIFTKPVGERQTLFLEVIQRIGCMEKDEESGREQQRGGCGGFGKGNFHELFKAVEEYEKSLEAKLVCQ